MNNDAASSSPAKAQHVEQSLQNVRDALLRLRYGTIALTVHDDRIVQIDITEKQRLGTS